MSKSKKVFLRILPVVLVLMVVTSSSVFGFNNFTADMNIGTTTNEGITSANTAVSKVWNTVVLILQILAVAAVVLAGVRYMFASPDGKADIKNQTIGLIVGAVLVFGASFIINFIVGITREVTT